jgi:hypothetical protein
LPEYYTDDKHSHQCCGRNPFMVKEKMHDDSMAALDSF